MSHTKSAKMDGIIDLIAKAAAGRVLSSAKPWNYGWSQPEYRRSPVAAMTHDAGHSVSLTPTAVLAFEQATNTVLSLAGVSERYDREEFWGLMASLLGKLPMNAARHDIESSLLMIVNPPDSLVVLPLANLAHFTTAIRLGRGTIGPCDESLLNALRSQVESTQPSVPEAPWWMSSPACADDVLMVLTYQSRTQLRCAIHEAEQFFEDTVAIALALQSDLDARALYSLRGDLHRPGIRGLVLDRAALAAIGTNVPQLERELSSCTFVSGISDRTVVHRWNGEDPFPLHELLNGPEQRSTVERILFESTAVHRRLRVAARWHAKAHWASEIDDAVLALGISLDAMLTEQGPTPGRALAERYAFLASSPAGRRARFREFQKEFYPARSAVAHGARKTSVDYKFVRRLASEVRWIFRRLIELAETHQVRTEEDYEELHAMLKWGSAS